ncbi:MAG TPA: beta-ketoacyl-[acyl-carrier-protein] synthase II [Bacteroidales bacterium]|nr:MAG: beta-ketoacyl-[acyl-carrier-protein] synthase II [Bacteroidetes bacterium GWE2_42_24]OFY26545.1 MAG: beta-ketoacyl-[acyl-carrier-protein] synthase II [Bacteroidetes bacterium GWF2_43_11]HBZ67422.1 beta-ketoacyl-[acyl-carrier-protein] synthase II [Bacteroidales bacterium]
MKRAVITGLGAVTPIGNNVNDFWENLVKGKSGAAPITKFDTTNFRPKFACEVKGFDPLQYMEKQEARKMDSYTQYAIAAADECIKDSGLDLKTCDLNKVGVIVATGIGGLQTLEEEIINFADGNRIPRFSPFFITKMIANIATGQISIRYGLHGVSYTISSACASSNNAIGNALDLIRLGRANIILAGGAEASITQSAIGGFNSMKALSTLNDSPETASRPFDKTRDGFVAGEGAGVLMIEELEHALKRGAKIYCELAGYGAASDAYHVAITHPEGLGAIVAMEEALSDAGISPGEVDYINAHATSTHVGDTSECKAIEKVFTHSLHKISISATKSMTGHLLGAAGAIEAIACIKAIGNSIIPPTINLNERDSELNPQLDFTPLKAINKEVLVALNNTFGFGGHTSTTVFKKFIP